jgi:phosphoglycolate phosphatase-like HAD superfamily hydrolase
VRRLILWDIDGTLIRSGTVGRRAVEAGAAMAASLVDVPIVEMSGKTDPQILREIFLAADIAEDRIVELLPAATQEVERALAAAEAELRRDGWVLPGVVEVLEELADRDGVRQTLLTGNLTANAALKVAAFDLLHYFDVEVGAYGTDNADRLTLVPIALDRVRRLRDEQYDPDEVWVIGDTPNDLACARAAGVRCLLVGTGAVGSEPLDGLGAEATLADLSDTETVIRILL